MASKDFTAIPNTTANEIQENITTHNILVLTLIVHYIRDYATGFEFPQNTLLEPNVSKFHRSFSMLVLHLIQCPDLTFEQLNNVLSWGKFHMPKTFIHTFHLELHSMINCDVDTIIGMFKTLEIRILNSGIPTVNERKSINGSSPIGVFIRRILIFFEKMLFLQAEAIIKEARNHCNAVFEKLPVRMINNCKKYLKRTFPLNVIFKIFF